MEYLLCIHCSGDSVEVSSGRTPHSSACEGTRTFHRSHADRMPLQVPDL